MVRGKGVNSYKKTITAYTKRDYFEILSDINIDFIMIAHQKRCLHHNIKFKPIM